MEKDYNSQRDYLILKEYGRNIQNLVSHLLTIEDRADRTRSAYAVIELMKQVNPAMKESPEYAQKLWDDLYIISNFELDVEGPYPMPERKNLGKKPSRVAYPHQKTMLKHYGQNIELLVQKVLEVEDEEEQKAVAVKVGRLMRSFYYAWNKEMMEESVILEQLRRLSKGKIKLDIEEIMEHGLFEANIRQDHGGGYQNQNQGGGRRNQNRGKRNYGNNKRRRN